MDSLKMAADDLRSRVAALISELMADPKFAEINKSIATLHSIEDLIGEPRTELGGMWSTASTGSSDSASTRTPTFRQDEFYGLKPLEAAKRVLKKFGKSTRFSDIVAGIKSGGGDPANEDDLRVSLARSTIEVAKIGEDLFGLVEFYPHITRGKPGRRKKNGSSKEDSAEAGSPEDASAETETPDVGASGAILKGDS